VNEARARKAGGGEQRVEVRDAVGHAGKNGSDDKAGMHAGVDELVQCPQPGRRDG